MPPRVPLGSGKSEAFSRGDPQARSLGLQAGRVGADQVESGVQSSHLVSKGPSTPAALSVSTSLLARPGISLVGASFIENDPSDLQIVLIEGYSGDGQIEFPARIDVPGRWGV